MLLIGFNDPEVDAAFRLYRPAFMVIGETPSGGFSLCPADSQDDADRVARLMMASRPDPRCTVQVCRVASDVRPFWIQ